MVHIRENHLFNEDGSICFDQWISALQSNGAVLDVDRIKHACDISWEAHQKTDEPEHAWFEKSSSYITGLDMAEILVDLHLDTEAILAASKARAAPWCGHHNLPSPKRSSGFAQAGLPQGARVSWETFRWA